MGNATSTSSFTRVQSVPLGSPSYRTLAEGQFQDEPASMLSFATDATGNPLITDISKILTGRIQSKKKIEGLLGVMHVETTPSSIDLIVPPVKPLSAILRWEDPDEPLVGLYTLGRCLHLLHTQHNLSHNGVSLNSVFVQSTSRAWLLAEDLLCDLRNIDNWRVIKQVSAMLSPAYNPPEFDSPTIDYRSYPIHARDAFQFAVLTQHFLDQLRIRKPASAVSILSKMSAADYRQRPQIMELLNDALFTANPMCRIVARVMDARHGLLNQTEAQELFTQLPHLIHKLGSSPSAPIVIDTILKPSLLLQPTALSTKFIPLLLTLKCTKSTNTASPSPTPKTKSGEPFAGLFPLEPYRKYLLPFLGECWIQENSAVHMVLLKYFGRYVNRMNSQFVNEVICPKILALNVIGNPTMAQAYFSALPILMKHHVRKSLDAAPIVRHVVQQIVPTLGNNETLRLRALTCLLVHPNIPNLLLKEYFAKGLTDTSPTVRSAVITAIKKFGITFGDHAGPMSPKTLADGVIGPLLLSMIDSDAKVREQARIAIRKLTFVMERKEEQVKAFYQKQSSVTTSQKSGKASTSNGTKATSSHSSHHTVAKSTSSNSLSQAKQPGTSSPSRAFTQETASFDNHDHGAWSSGHDDQGDKAWGTWNDSADWADNDNDDYEPVTAPSRSSSAVDDTREEGEEDWGYTPPKVVKSAATTSTNAQPLRSPSTLTSSTPSKLTPSHSGSSLNGTSHLSDRMANGSAAHVDNGWEGDDFEEDFDAPFTAAPSASAPFEPKKTVDDIPKSTPSYRVPVSLDSEEAEEVNAWADTLNDEALPADAPAPSRTAPVEATVVANDTHDAVESDPATAVLTPSEYAKSMPASATTAPEPSTFHDDAWAVDNEPSEPAAEPSKPLKPIANSTSTPSKLALASVEWDDDAWADE